VKLGSLWGACLLLSVCSLSLVACRATASPTPTCRIEPQPTGEKTIPIAIGTPPPRQVQAGQALSLTLSGGYFVANNARICPDGTVEHVYSDELPGFNPERTFDVLLDERHIAEVTCVNECLVEVTIPEDVTPGNYQLRLRGWSVGAAFDLAVVAPSSQ
jgi:hypothetical protein